MTGFDDILPSNAPFDGAWWTPADPSHIVAGRLGLEGEIWSLTLFGWLGPWHERHDTHEVPDIVHGRIGGNPITLFDLVPGGWKASRPDPPYESRAAVHTAIVGLHADESTRFTAAAVRLLHLNEWADRSPWSYPSNHEESATQIVAFTQPTELFADVPGARASLYRTWSQRGGDLSSVSMTSDECMDFNFRTPLDLEAIEHDFVRPLKGLIELAAGERSATLDLTVLAEGTTALTRHSRVLSTLDRRPPPPQFPFRFLFQLKDRPFDVILPAWWKLHSELGVVADLISALRRDGGYVGDHFLNAASAIEGYHRHRLGRSKASQEHRARIQRILSAVPDSDRTWLRDQLAFSHEPTFSERVDYVVDRAGPLFAQAVGNAEDWRTWVKKARNSIAHRDPSMVDVEGEWRTTARVTATIRWLMTLVLLRDLEIPESVIKAGVRQHGGLHAASRYLREVRPDWFA